MFKPQKISYLMNQRKDLDKKFTKSHLCDVIDLTPVALDSIIAGKSNPKIHTLEKIADFFNVDMNYFFDYYETKPIEQLTCQSHPEPYGDNPWKICFELQKEITDLKAELEVCRKFQHATVKDAKAG
jgi:transcriptional regulator with XRE-family HTH domain